MNDQVLKFKELIEVESVRKRSATDKLLPFKGEIKEARLRKFSYQLIAKFLNQTGVDISKTQVRSFCVSELGEKPKKRKAAKSQKSENSVTHRSNESSKVDSVEGSKIQNTMTSIEPSSNRNPLPHGFRVPTDHF